MDPASGSDKQAEVRTFTLRGAVLAPVLRMSRARFRDRHDAGEVLAASLRHYRPTSPLVLALPRGGVPVAYEVAESLDAELDVWVVRKLGVPGHEELAMGAIAPGGVMLIDRELVGYLGITDQQIRTVADRELRELDRRERAYREGRTPPDVSGRTVLLIDDGLATGSSMRVAVSSLRAGSPAKIVVAVPIGPPDTCEAMRAVADEVVCARTPEPFHGVGLWYENFDQTTDDEVRDLLAQAATERAAGHRTNESLDRGPPRGLGDPPSR
jgi:putative phosphoribosyl transferase